MSRILLVDDHAIVRRGLQRLLHSSPAAQSIQEAATGGEALDLLRASDFDVVILDAGLPDRSGLDVLKQIRAQHPRVRVLVLSMYPEEQYALRFLRAGASGYLMKEAAPEQLTAAIERVRSGGKYVSPEMAERLVSEVAGERPAEPHELLSDREFQVLRLLAEGKSQGEVAAALSIGVKTVATHRASILEKLQLRTTAQIVRYAVEHGLV